MPDPTAPEPLIDPDCRDGKCQSCIGGPCEHDCHTPPLMLADAGIGRPAPERTLQDDTTEGGQFWADLREGLKDDEFRAAYEATSREIAVTDAAANRSDATTAPVTKVNKTSEFDAIVNDMAARHAAHKLQHHSHGTSYRPRVSTSCSCGWTTGVTDDLRPQWAAIDKHLIDDVLPQWQSGVCWCGRAMLLGPLGRWFHAQPGTLGHDAAPKEAI